MQKKSSVRLILAALVLQVFGLGNVAAAGALHLRHQTQASSTSATTSSSNKSSSIPFDEFPLLDDVSEMANLSHSVYGYKKYPDVDGKVCDDWNNGNSTKTHRTARCHWYRHDKTLGTQVMIVTSSEKDYLAVVFAGTDDLLTTLLDIDIKQVDFGTRECSSTNGTTDGVAKIPVHLKNCSDCKVHEGFNNAVFGKHIFDDIYVRVEALRNQYTRLFVTGHSLGAADSMLTALALAIEFEKKTIDLPHPVTSINFGGPQIGNEAFQKYIHSQYLSHPNNTRHSRYLSVWRFVMGWDLVPRLPVGYEHIGHTVQMHHSECKDVIANCYRDHKRNEDNNDIIINSKWVWPDNNDSNTTKDAMTYYHHYGKAALGYAGVPSGWSAKPYLWVPGALASHAIGKYAEYFYQWETYSSKTWIHDFVNVDDDQPSNNNDDKLIDDDAYAEPPDDDAYDAASLLYYYNNDMAKQQ